MVSGVGHPVPVHQLFLKYHLTQRPGIPSLNAFDSTILLFLNSFAQRSWHFDHLVALIAHSNLLKGGFIMALLWGAWFKSDGQQSQRRDRVLVTIVAGFAALAVGRALQLSLPFRPRPIHNPEFPFTLPWSVTTDTLGGWSSLPSDHAVLYFGLATGCFFLSRVLGWVALVHATFVVSLPRIYLGFHHPTDILAGAAVGAMVAWSIHYGRLSSRIGFLGQQLADRYPAVFYAVLFVVSFEIAEMGDSLRSFGHLALDIFHRAWQRLL